MKHEFAVYLDSGEVLLADGAWTMPHNCGELARDLEVYGRYLNLHKPKLFYSVLLAGIEARKHRGAYVGPWV